MGQRIGPGRVRDGQRAGERGGPARGCRAASAARKAGWPSWPPPWELVGEVGFGGLTIEGIAARSGTGKQTVYRWWPSKADVLLEALAAQADLHIPIPDDGSYAADLLGS